MVDGINNGTLNYTNSDFSSRAKLAGKNSNFLKLSFSYKPIIPNSFPKRSLEIPRLQISNSKAKKLLRWKPTISLNEGLKITASYYASKK